MTSQTLLLAAKQGDVQSIAALMNRSLSAKGVTAKAQLTAGYLHIILEAAFVPNQPAIVAYVTKGMRGLAVPGVKSLVLYGRQQGAEFHAWTEHVELEMVPTVPVLTEVPVAESPEPVMSTTRRMITKVPAAVPLPSVTGDPSQPKPTLPWYETRNEVMIIALLVLFFPLGLWSMWKHSHWTLKKKGLITGGFALFLLVSHHAEPTPSAPSVAPIAVAPPVPAQPAPDAQPILNAITREYGYSRFIDTWGMGTRGLFLPDKAWNSLTAQQQQTLIQYAQSRGLTGIVVGSQLPGDRNAINLDRSVWGE